MHKVERRMVKTNAIFNDERFDEIVYNSCLLSASVQWALFTIIQHGSDVHLHTTVSIHSFTLFLPEYL